MLQVRTTQSPQTGREQIVGWLRELGECRAGGLVSDEDYGYQRAEKLDQLLHPPRCLWLASGFGAILAGAIGGGTTWLVTQDWLFTASVAAISGLWGINSVGRLLREKFIDLQLRERRKLLLALLDNDLLDANEFADFDERLQAANPSIVP